MHTEGAGAVEGWPQAHRAEEMLQHLGNDGRDLISPRNDSREQAEWELGWSGKTRSCMPVETVVRSCIWEEAEEETLAAGEDGGTTGFTVLLCTARC